MPITLQRHAKAVLIRRLLQMHPTNPSFWKIHHYYPSWRVLSKALRTPEKKKERKWRHRVA